MKNKKILVILLASVIMLLTGCTNNKGYKEISYNKLKEMVNNKETFALFIGRETCSSCDVFKEILNDLYAKDYAKEATIYYIDTDKLTDSESAEFHSKYYYEGTPTVTIIIEGKFSSNNSVTGSNGYNDMIELMKSKGLLKSDISKTDTSNSNNSTSSNEKGYLEITYSKLNEMVNSNQTFALFIGRELCSACTLFKSILNNHYTSEYSNQAKIYYIDLDKLSDSEYNEFNSKYYYEGTPTVTIIVKGKFSSENSVAGTNSFSSMIDLMKNKGLLKG